MISGCIGFQQDFGRKKNCSFGINFVYCNKLHSLSLLLHLLLSIATTIILQPNEHIFHNYFLSVFIITCLFLLLLLSISQVQICLVAFYFSPFVAGILFQLVLNYLQVAESCNTTFFLCHSSYRCAIIFRLYLFFACNFVAVFFFSILCLFFYKLIRFFFLKYQKYIDVLEIY